MSRLLKEDCAEIYYAVSSKIVAVMADDDCGECSETHPCPHTRAWAAHLESILAKLGDDGTDLYRASIRAEVTCCCSDADCACDSIQDPQYPLDYFEVARIVGAFSDCADCEADAEYIATVESDNQTVRVGLCEHHVPPLALTPDRGRAYYGERNDAGTFVYQVESLIAPLRAESRARCTYCPQSESADHSSAQHLYRKASK